MEKDDSGKEKLDKTTGGNVLVEIGTASAQDTAKPSSNRINRIKRSGGGHSKLTKLLGEEDEELKEDPRPGPSNSASDFDLEVFDSGSSCSNEECWGADPAAIKKLGLQTELDKEVESLTQKMSEYPSDSETELTLLAVNRQSRETQTGADLLESAPSTSQEPDDESTDLPTETLNRRESVELWKSKNVTETIVEDHDVYGTDENEDSLDSLHNEDSMDSMAISSRRTSVCDQSEVILVDQNLSRCCSRTSNPDLDPPESEDAHQPICDLYTQTCSSPTGRSYEVKTSQTESEYFEPVASTSRDPGGLMRPYSAALPPPPVKQTANFQSQTEAENFRPKRKSGSYTELSLACLPLKRQKPATATSSSTPSLYRGASEEMLGSDTPVLADSTPLGDTTPLGDSSMLVGGNSSSVLVGGNISNMEEEDEEEGEEEFQDAVNRIGPLHYCDSTNTGDSSYLSLCDNTAPTSPASPATPEEMEDQYSQTPPQPSPRALYSPASGAGRNLIPDRENPPPEILGWVATFARWSNAERLMAIDQLINTCEPQQVRHMMQVIEPQFQRDFISLLPKELALYVLSYLEPKDLLRAAQTCRYWRVLAEDNLLWREKCREAGLQDCREHYRRRKYMSGFAYSPWKSGFMRQHNIEMNWRIRPVKPPKVLKGHDDHVITCLQFSGNRIVSGSDDNTLKVWSAITGKCMRTLVGHTGGVWSSQMQGNVIVSGSTDRTLKVWNAESGACVHTLYGHTSTVRCMHLHNNKVVSGSRDATLRMWDIETGECNVVLMGHVAAVRCVQYDGRLVVSGAYDYMVKVWNPEREECIHTLNGHTNRVYSLQFDGTHVVSGSLDTSIRVWDVETGACKHALMGHQSLTSGMELKDNILVSGNADSTVKIWDIITGQCLQTLSGPNKHQSAVTCLHFNKKFVVTSSDDGTVKLWDVKSGDYIRDLVSLESGGSGGVVWRIRSSPTRLVCAVGSRNGTEETKLLVLDFDTELK